MSTLQDSGKPRLLAVLLNPPLITSGVRTLRAIDIARQALNYDSLQVVNLAATPTACVLELNSPALDPDWHSARQVMAQAVSSADGILAAWGVSGLTGSARMDRDRQVDWLARAAEAAGFDSWWMVGGQPRHPSRWHQYTSDKYGRTLGGLPAARLKHVLSLSPLKTWQQESKSDPT